MAQLYGEKYVKAILSQEIGWFDSCNHRGLAAAVLELTNKIQIGMGPKIGEVIQFLSQFIGAYIVGFMLSWRLTLVLLSVFPLILCCGESTASQIHYHSYFGGRRNFESNGWFSTATVV